jgi:hypothetical protein
MPNRDFNPGLLLELAATSAFSKHRRTTTATFRHLSCRNSDPELHMHALLPNIPITCTGNKAIHAVADKDRKLRSSDPIIIFQNKKVIAAYYRAALDKAIQP